MFNKIKQRINSDNGESNSVAMILWIAFAVIAFLVISTPIYNAIAERGAKTSECIRSSGNILTGGESCLVD